MQVLCPTCRGKGTISDPRLYGMPLMYCGPNGEACPQVTCRSCSGTGWIAGDEPRTVPCPHCGK